VNGSGIGGRGVALVLVAAVGYASAALVGTRVLASLDVSSTLMVRFGAAAALLAGIAAWRGAHRPGARTVVAGLVLGAAFYAPASGLYFASLTRLDAGMAAFLGYGYPAMVAAAAAALGLERLSRGRLAALVATLAGLGLMLLGAGAVPPDAFGAALAMSSAAGLAAYVLASALWVRRDDPSAVAALVAAGCALAFAASGAVSGGPHLPAGPGVWGLMAVLVIAGTVLPLVAFLAGIRRAGPGGASILMTAEPLTVALAGGLFLAQPLGLVQWAGAALVVGSVVVLARGRRGAGGPVAGGRRLAGVRTAANRPRARPRRVAVAR
jgi:drug/metabolite transporter (DMT)-like permease